MINTTSPRHLLDFCDRCDQQFDGPVDYLAHRCPRRHDFPAPIGWLFALGAFWILTGIAIVLVFALIHLFSMVARF